MIRVGIIGTIGVGKTSFIEYLKNALVERNKRVISFGEPSIIHGNINRILGKFYKDTNRWAYSLQLGISAAHEAIFTEIEETEEKENDYDVAIVDAPYSSYIYCNIHKKNGRLTEEERVNIDNVSRDFHFDYIILLEESADETIRRIKKRSRKEEKLDDLSYMYEHIEDFKLFRKGYLDKYFSDSEYIHLKDMPEIGGEQYKEIIDSLANTIVKGEE